MALVVSLYALAGIRMENMKLLLVNIKGHQLLALLDTSSTHNFLHAETMHCIGLTTMASPHLRVAVANGDHLACEGIAHNVPICFGDEEFSITCIGIDLGCFDFILGVDYLWALVPILWDFEALTLSFWRGDRQVVWRGVSAPGAAASQQALSAISADPQQPLLDHLLQQHSDIFAEPRGLPPVRPYDHRIHLLPGTAPVAVRPYHYP